MAILAALYHFGYWEGSQVQLESPTEFASVVIPPAMSVAPDPLQYQPTISIGPTTTVASPADVAPVPQQPAEAVLVTPPPLEAVPQPEAPARVETQPSAPKPTPVVKVNTGPSGLYLQVGALKDSVAARGLELRLRTAGFVVEVIDDSSDGLIRVISGPYAEMPQARIAAQEMSSLGVKSFPKRF
jgi:cell division septation protein DedD